MHGLSSAPNRSHNVPTPPQWSCLEEVFMKKRKLKLSTTVLRNLTDLSRAGGGFDTEGPSWCPAYTACDTCPYCTYGGNDSTDTFCGGAATCDVCNTTNCG